MSELGAVHYGGTANLLRDRIAALIPAHPEILQMVEPWGLFKVEGFHCDDIAPSLAQASWALAAAQSMYRATLTSEGG